MLSKPRRINVTFANPVDTKDVLKRTDNLK
jgi:hypothetical protein